MPVRFPPFRLLLPLAAVVMATWLLLLPAQAQDIGALVSRDPVLLTADSLRYDQDLGLVTAQGNVELAQESRTLLADLISYSERDGKVVASGNVSLMDTDGSVMFADYLELTDGMKNGFVRDVSVLLTDNSRFAAASAERRDGNRTTMRKAVYSPCSLCASDPTRAPLWQVRGDRVVHDQVKQEITYRDATVELFGVPVAYTPYFSHPDPTVRRQSGFLAPGVNTNKYFGVAVQTPYYYVIDDSTDLTITPQYSSREGPFLMGEYRQRTTKGEIRADASATRAHRRDFKGQRLSEEEFRGHLRADATFRANDDVTYGMNLFRATDDTYLSRYLIPNRGGNTLISRLYGEGINNRHFLGANAYSFQGLRSDAVPGITPIVAPLVDYSYIGQPSDQGARWAFDANMAALYRTGGTDTRRLSATTSWSLPTITDGGSVYTFTTLLKTDAYWVNEYDSRPLLLQNEDDPGYVFRAIPAMILDWRYPLIRDEGTIRQVVEPIVNVMVSPYGGNSRRIPNEDSLSFEFDEINLFSLNRFPGVDRFDGGPRVNYGLRTAAYGRKGGYSEVMVGQSFRLKEDDTFGPGSGVNETLSDYVARVTIQPTPYFSLTDRVRLSQNRDLAVQRQELSATLGPQALRLTVAYADIGNTAFVREVGEREAVSAQLRAQIGQYWSAEARHVRDLGSSGGSLLNFGALRYTDECFDLMLFVERTFTINRDIQPSTTIGLRFRLADFN